MSTTKRQENSGLRAVIIDDETHCIEYLKAMLDQHCPEVQIVATAKNGEEGMAVLRKHLPQLVFLDVEMPVMGGFKMLEEIGQVPFQIVFTTAFDRYALRAFKFSALDYLLKPVDALELKHTVQRASQKPAPDAQQISVLKNHLYAQNPAFANKIAIPTCDGYSFLSIGDIVTCEAESNYTKVHLIGGKTHLIARTLGDLEDSLLEKGFFRAHRQFLVNLAHIVKYVKADGGYAVMDNGQTITIARSRREEFAMMFEKF